MIQCAHLNYSSRMRGSERHALQTLLPVLASSLERGQGAVVGAGHGQARAAGAAAHQRPQQGNAEGGAFGGVGA